MGKIMGGSQNKFRPEPQDVWYKIRNTGRQPRLLQSVMQAIVDLKESNGSTHNKIVDYLQVLIDSNNVTPKPKGVPLQVRKAIMHGLKNGLIKQKRGKYQLAINQKDFEVFKSFRPPDPLTDCAKCKKAKRRRRGRRGRRGRRRRASATASSRSMTGAKRGRSDSRATSKGSNICSSDDESSLDKDDM